VNTPSVENDYPRGFRILLTRRWLGYLVLALVFAIACVSLGFWQFARLDEARVQIARIEMNYDAAPVAIGDVLSSDSAFDPSNTWLPVKATGTYVLADQLLVRSRPLDGQVGFEVLTPLRLTDGRLFIVDRGWIPSGETTAVPGDIPEPPRGTVEVTSRLKPTEPGLAGREATNGTVATIELVLIDDLLGGNVITGAYGLLASEQPSVTPMPFASARPELDEGPHLSYALQWILFAIMGFVGLGLAVRNERRIRDGVKPADNRPVIGRRRTDESIEDEQIDRVTG
jgi:cytochrome oxidase assembly protein ShyY1